ncbi:acyltransferase family protein [Cobetia amphilecti]|uniref:acyltransferase family protein n=1 Tax=Cobetia amphilecti TaxID=1055104 RepID=UPI002551A36C|nr:acyltransferase [Cobetia amphilecti]
MNEERVYILDVIRMLAALSVALYHYTWFGADDIERINFGFISEIFAYGELAVQLFFMISGFVIAWSVYNKSAFGFLRSRVLRLYPTYWICLLATCMVLFFNQSLDLNVAFFNLTMFQQFVGVAHIDGSYWTLTNEVIFYVYMCLIIKLGLTSKLMEIFSIHIFLCVVYWVYRIFMHHEPPIVGTLFLLEYGHLFIAGHVLYRMFFSDLDNSILLCRTILLVSFVLANIEVSHDSQNINKTVISCSIISLFFLFFIFMNRFSLSRFNKFKIKEISITIGGVSYPFYLLHQEIGYQLFNATNSWLNLIVCISSIIFLSYIINKLLGFVLRRKDSSLESFVRN